MQTLTIGLYFLQDLKLGHYMKVPPRATFVGAFLRSCREDLTTPHHAMHSAAQIVAALVTSFVQVGVKRWLVAVVPDLCARDQGANLSCPYAATYYSTSIIWCVRVSCLMVMLFLLSG